VVFGVAIGAAIGAAAVMAGQDRKTAEELTLRVTHHARGLHPGEAVRLTLTADRPIVTAEAEGFGRSIPLWPSEDARVWNGLIGVSLDTKPADYDVVIRATAAPSLTTTYRHSLTLQPKSFATRRIQVADGFANPPADEAERIQRDARLLADTFAGMRRERLWHGPFVRPVPGQATSSYGRLTILNGQPGSRHMGADFRAVEGASVRAPNAGEVLVAEALYFAGNTVIIDHGFGLFSLFGHLSRIAVEKGTRVARGDLIGEAGATGRVTGPHLHWAVRLGETSIDPLSLMVAVDDTTP
jgi:murein DD-endopeptidase MepM/ murein hydrolase activator NlpD